MKSPMHLSPLMPPSPLTLLRNPPRANVLGVGVHAINVDSAVSLVRQALDSGEKGYVCITGVHGVMEAQKEEAFRRLLNNSFLVMPDGMPTVWVGRFQGHRTMGRVFGPDLMLRICRESVAWGTRHFLYGGQEGVAMQLRDNLLRQIPGLHIVGAHTPPILPLSDIERQDFIDKVAAVQPDVIWVGLSTPKQEKLMAEMLPVLQTKLMFGVGAAFDVHTGRIKDSSDWIKRAGLQWAHRLLQEPRRLWKRYLVNNPKFLVAIASQLAGLRKYDLNETG